MKKSTRLNILFAIIILLAAGVLWLCFGHPAAGSGLVAVLTYGDDSTQLRIPLDTDHRYDIDTGYYTIHLVVENGGIRFHLERSIGRETRLGHMNLPHLRYLDMPVTATPEDSARVILAATPRPWLFLPCSGANRSAEPVSSSPVPGPICRHWLRASRACRA